MDRKYSFLAALVAVVLHEPNLICLLRHFFRVRLSSSVVEARLLHYYIQLYPVGFSFRRVLSGDLLGVCILE